MNPNTDTNRGSGPNDDEVLDIVDIEEFAKTDGGKPPKAKIYRIRVDKTHYEVPVSQMTGRAILELAGKQPPERWMLNQKKTGGQIVAIALEEIVDFTAPGVERFMTLPKDQTEGHTHLRREFTLPAEDVEALNAGGYHWEAVNSGAKMWVLIHNIAFPAAFRDSSGSVAVAIPPAYPSGALDMAYFSPAVARRDGKPIARTEASVTIDGRPWQRWSRHYTAANPWKPGEYNVVTHLQLVRSWLDLEAAK